MLWGGTTLLPHLQLCRRPPDRAPRSPSLSPTTASIPFRAVSAGERQENPQKSSKQDKYVVQTKAVLGGMRFRLLPDGVDPSEEACGLRKMRHLLLSAGLIASATPKRAHAGGAHSEEPGSGWSLASRSPNSPAHSPAGLQGFAGNRGMPSLGCLRGHLSHPLGVVPSFLVCGEHPGHCRSRQEDCLGNPLAPPERGGWVGGSINVPSGKVRCHQECLRRTGVRVGGRRRGWGEAGSSLRSPHPHPCNPPGSQAPGVHVPFLLQFHGY